MKTVFARVVALFVFTTAGWTTEMPTYGPAEINMDYRIDVTAADQKFNRWFLLSGVVQAVRTDAWKSMWVEIRDGDDKVAMDYVAVQVRSDQRETIGNYRRWDEILLVCHGTKGSQSAGSSSVALVNNCSLATPPRN